MWILPKQLLTSPSAPATEGSTLDYEEFCQLAEQSLMWRSKLSPLRTWLARWRRVPWMQRLSGQTLRPVIGRSFVTEWILSAAAIRANHSVRRETAKAAMTPDTSGLTSKGQLGLFDQDTASLRTSKDTLPLGLKTSATTWESWVTSLRQEYSARLKSARLTREKEFSSSQKRWATPAARDYKGSYRPESLIRKDGKSRMDGLPQQAEYDPTTNWPTPTSSEGSKIPDKANYGQVGLSNHPAIVGHPDREKLNKSGKSQGKGNLGEKVQSKGMKLNPSWVEQLQGLPVGWTQLPTEWID